MYVPINQMRQEKYAQRSLVKYYLFHVTETLQCKGG